jgi:hypothetical protein
MAELRTPMSLMESLSGRGNRPAVVTMREEGAGRWSR